MKITISSFLIAIMIVLTSSCKKKEGCTDATALNFDPTAELNCCCEYSDAFDLTFHMHNYIGPDEVTEGNTYVINGVNTKLDITRFYVSNIRLVDADGIETTATGKYLLITPAEETYPAGALPAGNYTKLRFDIGIDSITNHADPSQYPLNDPLGPQFPNMHWGWDFGYIFIRIDGFADKDLNGSTESAFEMHIGKDSFLTTIELDYPFETEAQKSYAAHIVVNWTELFAGIDMTGDIITHTTDNLDLANQIINNLGNVFTKEE